MNYLNMPSNLIVDTDLAALRKKLVDASIIGEPVALSHVAAGVVGFAISAKVQTEMPPGSHACWKCEGTGVVHKCVVCGSQEAGKGTCGSDDPRALCNFSGFPLIAVPGDKYSLNAEEPPDGEMSDEELRAALRSEFDLDPHSIPTPLAMRAARAAMAAMAKKLKLQPFVLSEQNKGKGLIPEGYRLVKIVPDDAMQKAGALSVRIDTTILNRMYTANRVFSEMCAASSLPPDLTED